jgi:TolA-binding protein
MSFSETLKNKLNELLEVAKFEEAPAVEPSKNFVTTKTKDGVSVVYETLEVGASVMVVDAEGVEIPAPNGEHALEDGTVISTEEGKIVAIITVEEAEMKAKQAKEEEEKVNQFKAIEEKFSALEAKIKSLEAINESHKANFEKQVKIVAKFMEVVDELGKEKEEKTIVKSSFTKSTDEKENKIKELSQLIK